MTEPIVTNEPIIRLACFLGMFFVIALWEFISPRRQCAFSRWTRWPNNLSIVALNTLILRTLLPTAAIGVALFAEIHDWGLIRLWDTPVWLSVIFSLLILDLAIYLQHILFHAVPVLWRLHRMHHADLDLDVTTGTRFHPIEMVLSMCIKIVIVAAFGIPAFAVVIFEVLLNATAMFNHGNVHIPGRIDSALRWFIVTPDMHRVHHSVLPQEANTNFGFNLSWWDRFLGTYLDQPADGHLGMTIGIEQFRTQREFWLDRMILQPLHPSSNHYSINRETSA